MFAGRILLGKWGKVRREEERAGPRPGFCCHDRWPPGRKALCIGEFISPMDGIIHFRIRTGTRGVRACSCNQMGRHNHTTLAVRFLRAARSVKIWRVGKFCSSFYDKKPQPLAGLIFHDGPEHGKIEEREIFFCYFRKNFIPVQSFLP